MTADIKASLNDVANKGRGRKATKSGDELREAHRARAARLRASKPADKAANAARMKAARLAANMKSGLASQFREIVRASKSQEEKLCDPDARTILEWVCMTKKSPGFWGYNRHISPISGIICAVTVKVSHVSDVDRQAPEIPIVDHSITTP
jgi:hypothetical protein